MSSSVQHRLSILLEDVFGETPDPALNFTRKPITACTMGLARGTVTSAIINPNRQVTDVRPGNRQIGGEISTELTWQDHDDMFQALFCGTWEPRIAPFTSNAIASVAAGNELTSAGNLLPLFSVGEPITLAGMTSGNGRVDVVSSTTAQLVVRGQVLVDEAAGSPFTITSLVNTLTPGATYRSFSVLREYLDQIAGGTVKPYQLYNGVVTDKLVLTLQPEQIVKSVFSIFGKEYTNSATAPTGATFVEESGNKAFDSFSGQIKVDNVVVGNVTEMVLNLENGTAARFVCFRDTSNFPKLGKTKVTGQMTAYFEDSSLLDAFINGTKKSIDFQLVDGLGNMYEFTLPSVLSTGGQTDVSGDNDITIPWPFSAIYEPNNEVQDALIMTRTPAPLAA